MFTICDDIQQTDKIRSWIEELTNFTPEQVETAVQQLQQDVGQFQMGRL